MQPEEPNEKPPLKPWVLPLMLCSIAVIVLGVILTYVDTTGGAIVVLLGLVGIARAGWGAAGT